MVFELISDAVNVILQRPSGAVTEMILALATLTSDYRLWMGFLIAVRDRDRGRVTYGTNDVCGHTSRRHEATCVSQSWKV